MLLGVTQVPLNQGSILTRTHCGDCLSFVVDDPPTCRILHDIPIAPSCVVSFGASSRNSLHNSLHLSLMDFNEDKRGDHCTRRFWVNL